MSIISSIIRLINIPTLIFITLIIIIINVQEERFSKYRSIIIKLLKKIFNYKLINQITETNFNHPIRSRKQAAKKSLKSIDNLIGLINDNVAREGLKQEKLKVEKELRRGDLVVVVFGVGSSGKTSLIRALLNEIVGQVGAPMGSTKATKSYRLRLRGLERGIKIIDTPGILESGKLGRERENQALIKASKADLILVVVDSDLRSAEMEMARTLSNIGKRMLIILNKIDLRGANEEEELLFLLRQKCKYLLDPKDIVSTAASPQSIQQKGVGRIQPQPEISSLLERLAKVLHDEGEELLSDNILLQCESLGKTGRLLISRQREERASSTVEKYSWISSGVVAVTPLPGVDLLATAAVNAQMVLEIAKIYGVKITFRKAKELALSVAKTLAGMGIVKGGVNLISTSMNLNLPTLLISRAIQSISAAWLTKLAGETFITYFQQDQNWGDGGIQEVVQHHYDINRRQKYLNEFLKKAFNRVIEPLKNDRLKQLPPYQELQEEEEAWDPLDPT